MTDIIPALVALTIGLAVTIWALAQPHTRQPRRHLWDLLKGGDE